MSPLIYAVECLDRLKEATNVIRQISHGNEVLSIDPSTIFALNDLYVQLSKKANELSGYLSEGSRTDAPQEVLADILLTVQEGNDLINSFRKILSS